MNLVETLMGGVIFGLASMGSLQIYGSSLRATHGHDGRQQQANVIDLVLAGAHQELTRQSTELAAAGRPGAGACGDRSVAIAAEVRALIPASAQASGVQVAVDVDEELILITAQAEGQPVRRRWFSAAAYGLCGNPELEQSENANADQASEGIHPDRSPDGDERVGAGDGVRTELEPGGLGTATGGDGSAAADGGSGAGP